MILATRNRDLGLIDGLGKSRLKVWVIALVVASVPVLAVACGSSGSSEPSFAKITPDETMRDIDSFSPSRFKQAKSYDVSELPEAISAYMGYYTPAGYEPIQYELRMYADHASALANGVEYAAEVTGPDALLRSVDVRWDEGTKDRRGGGAFRDGLTPLYGDYAVYGNVILLCEGRDSSSSLARCAALLDAAGMGVGE